MLDVETICKITPIIKAAIDLYPLTPKDIALAEEQKSYFRSEYVPQTWEIKLEEMLERVGVDYSKIKNITVVAALIENFSPDECI